MESGITLAAAAGCSRLLDSGPAERYCRKREPAMHNEFTAVFERDGEWFIAYSPEIPGANGQGRTKEEARKSLADAIALILEDRREDGLRGVPPEAERDTVVIK
jgi:predicted RNase H-like HicB family nuclease